MDDLEFEKSAQFYFICCIFKKLITKSDGNIFSGFGEDINGTMAIFSTVSVFYASSLRKLKGLNPSTS